MKKVFLLLSLFLSTISFSQNVKVTDEQINNSGASQLTFIDEIEQAKNLAQKDIKNNTPFLLLQGGIAPTTGPTDKVFETKHNVYYYDYGCTSPDYKYIKAYNNEIFKYLTARFGKKWIKECRKDVIGLKEYRKNAR